MAIFSTGLKCTNSKCKNSGREDVERWELKDYLGYSCGIVCDDCYAKQKAKHESIRNYSVLSKNKWLRKWIYDDRMFAGWKISTGFEVLLVTGNIGSWKTQFSLIHINKILNGHVNTLGSVVHIIPYGV